VEKAERVGGAVANTGTLPSKTLRETALALSGLKARHLYGVDLSLRREATVADFMHHEKQVGAAERQRVLDYFGDLRITLHRGHASFVDAHTVRVRGGDGEQLLRGEKFLIATGSAPHRPAAFDFSDPRICDSDTILHIAKLPERLAVVGAGVIGSEYACTFAALGADVTIVDGRESLLGFLDREVSTALQAAMQDLWITFVWQDTVERCTVPATGDIELHLASGANLRADTVLVAAGRVSNTAALDLGAAGITPGEGGVLEVDRVFRTAVPHIYAAGDVVGFPALASTSMEQARVAMTHAFDLGYKTQVSPVLPNGIYTIPEVSMAGETEESLREKGIDYVVGKAPYQENARGCIIGDRRGFLKLLFRRDDMRLLGVHVIGEQATEIVHIGLLVLLAEGGFDLINRTCFNYPTLGALYQRASALALASQRGIL